ncbi:uncharacterized protein N7458_002531 [Penicillium daleae]|uniref:Uncharacterized protein n=1 Tax=Penicillium daleae TaxID=63821 RepID=A0AAD6G4C9_9EURO|nr:uncharacterized protein N7458_004986 [Penicillium daleae]XP_056770021.1 uncharacterized protein N7458_002531 [Penicillium daleae]KAJ5454030.1 hypothetical protein N7458_004986 [Penicillium daleae]KAJ5460979.1 hypothetical protein N7458_002531 [Penicillium daleae]
MVVFVVGAIRAAQKAAGVVEMNRQISEHNLDSSLAILTYVKHNKLFEFHLFEDYAIMRVSIGGFRFGDMTYTVEYSGEKVARKGSHHAEIGKLWYTVDMADFLKTLKVLHRDKLRIPKYAFRDVAGMTLERRALIRSLYEPLPLRRGSTMVH